MPDADSEVGVPDDLEGLTVDDLRDAARRRGLATSGRKDDLVVRIRAAAGRDPEVAELLERRAAAADDEETVRGLDARLDLLGYYPEGNPKEEASHA